MTLTLTRTQIILIAVAAVLVLVAIVFGTVHGCNQPQPVVVINPGGIDAAPGELVIANRLDGAVRAGEAQIARIELKFEDDLAAFDVQQRAEYDRLREAGDLEAIARELSAWNRERHGSGTKPR